MPKWGTIIQRDESKAVRSATMGKTLRAGAVHTQTLDEQNQGSKKKKPL